MIDRSPPSIGVDVAAGADYTQDPSLKLRIDYADAISPPWLGSNSLASNWVCVTRGSACTPGGDPVMACSAPSAWARQATFNCIASNTATSDGRWYFCAMAADAAVPDNPNGTNQFANAFSNRANLSPVGCDSVLVDRTAPAVTATASDATPTVGTLVRLTSATTDAGSGIDASSYSWDFGDNTQRATGTTATHTYTAPGTYRASATVRDRAGDTAQGFVTITVGKDGGGTGGGGDQGTVGVTPTVRPVTVTQVSDRAGGGGARAVAVGGADVVVPKRYKIKRRNSLLLGVTTNAAGTLAVRLARGATVVASRSASSRAPARTGCRSGSRASCAPASTRSRSASGRQAAGCTASRFPSS